MKNYLLGLIIILAATTACAQNNKEEKQEEQQAQQVQQSKFQEGVHYNVVSEKASEEPVVTEFFSLYCGHCFQFEAYLDTLKTSINGAKFEKSHVSYIPQNDSLQGVAIVKAFVMMEELGKMPELSKQFFARIHLGEEPLTDVAGIKEIFEANEVSSSEFDKLFANKSINEKTEDMVQLWQDRQIMSVPTLVVNDKYRINMGSVGSMGELIELTNVLLERKD
ncbi:thiol:disulfide interchange protein DsbA/DsbL [Roseivirga pacifica]|uniref:thiol:disulfide interchange protein DsbA/DsbL n=1 Tax=Roseivirga pacifica TaxID=1267423 RepID=UPI003BACCC83